MAQLKEHRILDHVLKTAVRGDPQSVLDSIDQYCRQKEWAMNVGDEKGLILDQIVKETDPLVLLELGTYCGYSAIRIARLMKTGARLLTVEMNPVHTDVAKKLIEFAGIQDKVQVLEGLTQDILPKLKAEYCVENFDFVFIDHFGDRYKPDTQLLEDLGLLKKGSVLVADNVSFTSSAEFLDHVRTSGRYDCTNYPSHLEYSDKPDAVEKAVYRG